MEQTEIAQSIIIEKPAGLKIASTILLIESLFFSFPLVLIIFTSGVKSAFMSNSFDPFGHLFLFLPLIFIPFCFLVSNMRKMGLYGIIVLMCSTLIYLIYILNNVHGDGVLLSIAFWLLVLGIIINLPILVYLLSIRKKFI